MRLQRNAMQNLVRTFKDLDTSKDGLLSKEELVDALKSGSVVIELFQRHGFCSQAFLKHLLVTNDKGIDFAPMPSGNFFKDDDASEFIFIREISIRIIINCINC